jgi:hypothetical protein
VSEQNPIGILRTQGVVGAVHSATAPPVIGFPAQSSCVTDYGARFTLATPSLAAAVTQPTDSQKSITGLAVVSVCAFGFRLSLSHVCTSFGLAVILRAGAVVDVTRGI